ncbi:Hsp70 family protein [Nocardioides zeae]|uniref:Hsp70 family protein n=1 Tax=Nocardioides imazamoxiresistens TaxID=3231893 RepID=A0ABU3Q0J8_9ACTN|nr:Hsp70 family protein [Nocardioides zeae]MDT9595043.1 Hsp70 family protein [Nocardioides zeae]
MGWTLSVDYGTTNTTAAIRHDGRPPAAVTLGEEQTMPSAALLTSGGIQVGEAALRGRRSAPEFFVASPKLLLGQDSVLLGDDETEVTALVARTLSVVLERAVAEAGGTQPDAVVLTHPQTWARPRRQALEAAWRRTGSRAPVRLVSEPIAAVSWFAEEATLPDDARVAVLDFGGGTCDVAVLHHRARAAAPLEITAHAGLDDLGGATVDHVFALWVRAQVRTQGEVELDDALDEREHLADLHALYDAVREAKHRLADWEYADVPVSAAGRSTSVTVTIDEFNQIIAAETERARALLERSVAAAGVASVDLHGLYLTGGSSRLRWVHQMAAELLGGRPAHLAEPHLVVALGAHSATRLRVVERADVEASRFVTLRGLQASPATGRGSTLAPPSGQPVSLTPPRPSAPPRGPRLPAPAGPPAGPPAGRPVAAPPPAARGAAPRPTAGPTAPPGGPPVGPPSGPPAGPPVGPPLGHPGGRPSGPALAPVVAAGQDLADVLLAAHPSLAAATGVAPELRALLDQPATLVALLAVPGLLEQVARHPALLTTPPTDGRPRTFSAPDDDDSAVLPARQLFGRSAAWRAAVDAPAWRRSFLAAQGGGPAWAYAVVQRWSRLPAAERRRALEDPTWTVPPVPVPPWIERSPGRVSVTVPAPRPGPASGAGFLRARTASREQAGVLAALEARGCFGEGEAFRERLNAARDPRLPARRAGVSARVGTRDAELDVYLFGGGRHRARSGGADTELPAYVLLLPTRHLRTSVPLLVLTRDLVDHLAPAAHGDVAARSVVVALTQEVGGEVAPTGRSLTLTSRDAGLGVELARTLDRPWVPGRGL